MAIIDESVPITLNVPRSVVERVGEAARLANRTVEQEAEALLERGLSTSESVRASADRAYRAYQEHLQRTDQEEPTAEELMEQLRRVRAEVAHELDSN